MTTDRAHYRYFKNRARALLQDDDTFETHIDSEIHELIRSLNSIPGVATVWSCSGHETGHSACSHFYIVLVSTQEGTKNILDLYRQLTLDNRNSDGLRRKGWFPLPDLQVAFLDSPFGDDAGVYRCWSFELRGMDEFGVPARELMFKKFISSIKAKWE